MNCSLPCFHSMQRRLNGEKIQTQEKSKPPLCDTLAKALARNEKFATLASNMKVFNMF